MSPSYLPSQYYKQTACHSFSAYHGGDTVDENQEQSHTRDLLCSGEIL